MCNDWCHTFGKQLSPLLSELDSVLEVGSRDVNGSLRQTLQGQVKHWHGVDIAEGPGVDEILDVSELKEHFGEKRTFDLVVSTEMLEHCRDWRAAVWNMLAVLNENGLLLITTRSPGFEWHDYPEDHWRFSSADMFTIFSPVGTILSIEDDMTLGWPCGIGIILRRNRVVDLDAWRAYLQGVEVAGVEALEAMRAQSAPEEWSDLARSTPFDQYSRYHMLARAIRHVAPEGHTSILDVGSGYQCLLGKFLPERELSFSDPLLANREDRDRSMLPDPIESAAYDKMRFDVIVSMDTLEHMPPAVRTNFVSRISQLANQAIILAFPCAETEARHIDELTNQIFISTHERENPWIIDHLGQPLPSLTTVERQLRDQGWIVTTYHHGHAAWMAELFPTFFSLWEVEEARPALIGLSQTFNTLLANVDSSPASYRAMVIATKERIAPLPIPEPSPTAEIVFHSITHRVNRVLYSVTAEWKRRFNEQLAKSFEFADWATALRKERDNTQLELEKIGNWGKGLEKQLAQEGRERAELQKAAEDVSAWAKDLEKQLTNAARERDQARLELDTVGNWGKGMETQLRETEKKQAELQKAANEVSAWAKDLEEQLTSAAQERDRARLELEKIGNWGNGLEKRLQEEGQERAELQKSVDEVSAWAKGMEKQLVAANQERDQALLEMGKIEKWGRDMEKQLTEEVRERAALQKSAEEASARADALNNQLAAAAQERDQARLELEKIGDWGKALEQKLDQEGRERAALQKAVEEMSAKAKDVETQLDESIDTVKRLGQALQDTTEAADATTADLDKLRAEHEAVQVRNVELQEKLVEKHTELMTMSDWAAGLNARIGVVDSNLLLSILLRFVTAYRELGFWGTIRHIVKRCVPYCVTSRIRVARKKKELAALKKSIARNPSKVVVAFPIIPWNFRWQRPQQLLSHMVEAGYIVLHVNLHPSPRGRVFSTQREVLLETAVSAHMPGVYEIHAPCAAPFNIYSDKMEGENLETLRMAISTMLGHLKVVSPILMVQFPGWAPLALALKAERQSRLVFDCMDDHSGFENTTQEALDQEQEMASKADLVLASSDLLFDKMSAYNKNTLMIRNGTEFDHFHGCQKNGQLDSLDTAKPIIGYYGAIAEWFDMDLVIHCARKRPDWQFVLIGHAMDAHVERTRDLSNVHMLGEKPYAELPGFLAYFDVCIIPFRLIPLILATNPVKFYEYLSCAKPIVSVPLPELEQYRDICYLAENPDDFVASIENALKEDLSAVVEARLTVARQSSWKSRADSLINHQVLNI